MKSLLWRLIYAVIVVLILFKVVPLFCSVVGFTLTGDAWQLIRICLGGLAVLYVLFGPDPKAPF